MHRSDDIANLFNRLGASVGAYQEIEPQYDYDEDVAVVTHRPVTASANVPVAPVATEALPQAVDSRPLSRLLRELEQQREREAQGSHTLDAGHAALKAKVIALVSTQGGVGKSTLAGAVGSALKRAGGTTLAADLSPQNALCLHLGGGEQWPGLAQANPQDRDPRQLLRDGYGGSQCLAFGAASEPQRLAFEQQLAEDPLWLGRHLAALDLSEHDTVIIDTPPGASVYLAQALEIADVAVVVTHADAAAYAALDQMDRLLAPYRQGPDAVRCGFVVNQLDTSRQFSLDMFAVLKTRTSLPLLGVIHQDHFLGESLAYDRNPLAHPPSTRGCQDTLDLIESLCHLLTQGTQES